MMTVIDANLLPLIIALLVGFVIGWWMFRRNQAKRREGNLGSSLRSGSLEEAGKDPSPPVRPYMRNRPIRDGIDTEERRGVSGITGGAAAITDVAGEVLGVDAHAKAPGEGGAPDDLQTLKGVGPKLAQKLNENGIFRFEQLAALSPNEVAMLDAKLGPFKGRLERDRIVEQASYLARGDREGFEARFGSLGSS